MAARHRSVILHQRVVKLVPTALDSSPYVRPHPETFGEEGGRYGESGLFVDVLVIENGRHRLELRAIVRQGGLWGDARHECPVLERIVELESGSQCPSAIRPRQPTAAPTRTHR